MNWREKVRANRRLCILRMLHESTGYEAGESLIHEFLDVFGHNVSRDLLRTDLTWLQEQGLLSIEIIGTTHIATLSERGADVATDRATVPGVKRPSPKG